MQVFFVHNSEESRAAHFRSEDWDLLEQASAPGWRGVWRPLSFRWSADGVVTPSITNSGNALLVSDSMRAELLRAGLLKGRQVLELRGPDGAWWSVKIPYADNVDVDKSEFHVMLGRPMLLKVWVDGGGRAPLFRVPGLASPIYCTERFVDFASEQAEAGLAFSELPRRAP